MQQTDIDFLYNLQKTLNATSNNDSLWGVMDEILQVMPDGYGDCLMIVEENKVYTLDEYKTILLTMINEIDDQEEKDEILENWESVDQNWHTDVVDFANDIMGCMAEVMEYAHVTKVSEDAGYFLTKEACELHIKKYRKRYNKPIAYSLLNYQNSEITRLLNIVKNLNIDKDINKD